jgi:hypothetical protein
MRRLAYRQSARAGVRLTFAAFLVAGCTAGVKSSLGGGGAGGNGSGTGGAAGTSGPGTGGTTGAGNLAGTFAPPPPSDAGACQQYDVMFTPKTPTVFVLVDRSGSEFTDATTGTFFTLRSAVLQVLQQLHDANANIRLGFGAFVGDHASGQCKPVFDTVPIDVIANSYDPISSKYNSLGPLLPYGSKADTPAEAVIPMVKSALQADTGNGQKYMLFVTDSETDFCDDGGAECPADAITYQVQDMYTAGIGTLVVGLASSGGGIAPTVLQNLANAGAGQPVIVPPTVSSAMQLYYNCTGAGSGQWMSLWTAAGRTGLNPIATYSATAGSAPVYSPGGTSQTALAAQISAALADVKSCTFDLGGHISVVTSKLDKASVVINGSTVPLDPNMTNGWYMSSPTVLQLYGPACDMWRDPSVTDIKFNFPCEIIVT